MPIVCRLLAVLLLAAVCAPGAALGQTTNISEHGAGVSPRPPVKLDGERPRAQENRPQPAPARKASELPNTGSDPRLLFLAGVALTLFGVGLRLRTADAELY